MFLLFAVGTMSVRADEIQERFDTAYRALNEQRYYTAKELLEELVEDYPSLHRARLELARAQYLAGDLDAAEANAQKVLEDPEVPPGVRTTLLAFLAQIRDDKQVLEDRHDWAGEVYAGLLWDSNVNFGVDRALDLGGFTAEQEEEDAGLEFSGGLLHTYNPNVRFRSGEKTGYFLWQTQGNAYYRRYFSEDEFNLLVLTGRTGPTWLVPNEWRFNISLQGDQIWFDEDNLGFFTSINPNGTWYLDDGVTEISAFGVIGKRNYKRDGPGEPDVGRDGDVLRGGASIRHYSDDRSRWAEAGFTYTDYDADLSRVGYDSPEIYVAGSFSAWTNGDVYGRLGYREFDYDGPEGGILGPVTRDDDEWSATLGFTHDMKEGFLANWTVRGETIYTDYSSNVDLFEFDRFLVRLGIERSF